MQEHLVQSSDRLLVTGSNGFIGTKVVERLLEYGITNLRCFVRPSGKLENLRKVLSQRSNAKECRIGFRGPAFTRGLSKATQDVSVIIHLAAGMEKSFAGAFMNSALGYAQFAGCISRSWKAKAVRECQFLCGLFEFELKA